MKIFLIFYNIILLGLLPLILPIGYIVAFIKKEESDYFERFGMINFKYRPERTIWLHCASVGEVLSISDFVAHLREDMPNYKIVVTTMTASGKSVAVKHKIGDFVFLLPVENYLAIKYLTSYLNTAAFIVLDTELWPNMVYATSSNAKLFLLNGRLSDRSFPKYKALKMFFSPIINKFHKIFVKSEEDKKRFQSISHKPQNVIFMGNIKYFLKNGILKNISPFLMNSKFFLAASTHRGEEEIITDVLKHKDEFEHIVIAPRHVNRAEEVYNLFGDAGFEVSYYSAGRSAKVIVIDQLGILKNFYPYASKIFVGGSMVPHGGHNIFEGIKHKKIVATGIYMENFSEIYRLSIKHNVCFTINCPEDLTKFLDCKDESLNPDFDGFFEEIGCKDENMISDIVNVIKNEISC